MKDNLQNIELVKKRLQKRRKDKKLADEQEFESIIEMTA